MRLTVIHGEGQRSEAVFNPLRVDGARRVVQKGGADEPVIESTVLFIGPDEVHVAEAFAEVDAELAEAWERHERSDAVEQLLSPLVPLAGLLPLLVPTIIEQATQLAQEAAKRRAEASTSPPPAHGSAPAPAVEPCAPQCAPGTSTPPDRSQSGDLVVCRNCGQAATLAAKCPHCGAQLVGQG